MNYYLSNFPGRISLGLGLLSYMGFRILEDHSENFSVTTEVFIATGSFVAILAGLSLLVFKFVEGV